MYTVIEMQVDNGVLSVLHTEFFQDDAETNYLKACSKYHEILHYAAVSTVDIHSATILSEDGRIVANDGYRHGEH